MSVSLLGLIFILGANPIILCYSGLESEVTAFKLWINLLSLNSGNSFNWGMITVSIKSLNEAFPALVPNFIFYIDSEVFLVISPVPVKNGYPAGISKVRFLKIKYLSLISLLISCSVLLNIYSLSVCE